MFEADECDDAVDVVGEDDGDDDGGNDDDGGDEPFILVRLTLHPAATRWPA